MKRLIVSDIDGTLIPQGSDRLPQPLLTELARLLDAGYLFCPASGRQYNSLRHLFAPLGRPLYYICDNGGTVFGPTGEVIAKTPIPRSDAIALWREILALPQCEAVISGENTNYLVPKTEALIRHIRDEYHDKVVTVQDPEETPEEITKVSVYCAAGVEHIPPELAQRWRRYNPAVAGAVWLDFMSADKGQGLAALCRHLDISLSNVTAFGDNFNDQPLLALAGDPRLMSTAPEALLAQFPNHCDDVTAALKAL